jgi:hypothetical protein
MNYCDPNGNHTTALSAGDIAGVSRMDAYGTPYILPNPRAIALTRGDNTGKDVDIELRGDWTSEGPISVSAVNVPPGVIATPLNTYGTRYNFWALDNGFVGSANVTLSGHIGSIYHTTQLQITVDPCPVAANTCGSVGGPQCGTISLGCGVTANCGACPAGNTCESNKCIPDMCGVQSDQCGGTISCGGCAAGYQCKNGGCEVICTTEQCTCEQSGRYWINDRCVTCKGAAQCCTMGGGEWHNGRCI